MYTNKNELDIKDSPIFSINELNELKPSIVKIIDRRNIEGSFFI